MLPNHSCFGAIDEEHFLAGTRLLSSLEKINSSFLRKKLRKCRSSHNFTRMLLSGVSVDSIIGEGYL